jgi:hypothetical protein
VHSQRQRFHGIGDAELSQAHSIAGWAHRGISSASVND